MGLTGQQRKKLQQALINAFPTSASLEQMLDFELDKNLRAIAGEGSLQDIVFKLIQAANSQEWVKDLLNSALESNPENQCLKSISKELFPGQGIKTPSYLLFDLLLQMDFKQQMDLVEAVLEQHRTAAFLVHGERDCGQELLVTRLFRMRSRWRNNSPIKNDVTNRGSHVSTKFLWKQLAKSFSLSLDTEEEQILDRIWDRRQTQDVILIFKKVNCMPPKVLIDWLHEFWEPLVNREKLNPPPKDTCLLMFLVDDLGTVCKSQGVILAEQFNQPEYPLIPLNLPPVTPFPANILKHWLRDMKARSDLEIPSNLTYQQLWENSHKGIPQDVYGEICTHFDLDWEGDLARWLI